MEQTTNEPAPAEGQNEATAETPVQEPEQHPADALPEDMTTVDPREPGPIHFSRSPFVAVCGADIPNQRTTQIPENVTCPTCVAWRALQPVEYTPGMVYTLPKDDVLTRHLADIEAANRKVIQRKEEWDDAKEVASECKKSYDSAVDYLSEIISQGTSPGPLFDNVAAEPAGDKKTAQIIPDPIPADPDAWKSIPIAELIPGEPRIAELLAEKDITNFGQLEEWRAKPYEKIKGLGDVKRQVIDDAVIAYWIAHPRPVAFKTELHGTGSTGGATPVLQWRQGESEFEHVATNTAGVIDGGYPDGELADFVLEVQEDGQVNLDLSSEELLSTAADRVLSSLSAAKDWCEAQNRALVESRKAEEPAPSPLIPEPADILYASGKSWAISISTRKRDDADGYSAAWTVQLGEITNEHPFEGHYGSATVAGMCAIGLVRSFLGAVREKLDAVGVKAARAVEGQLAKVVEKLKAETTEEQAAADQPTTLKRTRKTKAEREPAAV